MLRLIGCLKWDDALVLTYIQEIRLLRPASDCDGQVVMTASPVKTRRSHWAGNTSLVGAGVGSNPTRNQIFLITFDLA